ncbi:hypothetical protein [Microvirga yunnanensis]|uniref:hypothetical protein n=1 Tax=Microvirga yunnanensis TaxID=2953740 RepID=UPI0035A0790B
MPGQLHGPDRHWDAGQIGCQFTINGSNVITGGLILRPAPITVLLFLLQLGQFPLGAATVAAFSLGLAITMVSIGVAGTWELFPCLRPSRSSAIGKAPSLVATGEGVLLRARA